MSEREVVSTQLSGREAEAVRRAAHELHTTPSNLVRQALTDTGVIPVDPARRSKPVDLALVADGGPR